VYHWLQRRGSNFYWAGIHAFVQKWKKTDDKVGDVLKNNYAFGSGVVKFSEISTCSTCKLHELKNRRHYFLTATCS
jgi:hypothetical protein